MNLFEVNVLTPHPNPLDLNSEELEENESTLSSVKDDQDKLCVCVCVRIVRANWNLQKRSTQCVFNTFLLSPCLFWTCVSNRTFYLISAYKLLKSFSCWHSASCWRLEGEYILLCRRGIRLELFDVWTWRLCDCVRVFTVWPLLFVVTVILDEWMDVP